MELLTASHRRQGPLVASHEATIDVDALTGDVIRGWRSKEDGCADQVFGRPQAVERDPPLAPSPHGVVGPHLLGERGEHEARTDGVDLDIVRPELNGLALSELTNSPFSRGVHRHFGEGIARGQRADVDDLAALPRSIIWRPTFWLRKYKPLRLTAMIWS